MAKTKTLKTRDQIKMGFEFDPENTKPILKLGSKIGMLAVGRGVTNEQFQQMEEWITSMGCIPVCEGYEPLTTAKTYADTDERRATHFVRMLDKHEDIDLYISMRGEGGCHAMIFEFFKNHVFKGYQIPHTKSAFAAYSGDDILRYLSDELRIFGGLNINAKHGVEFISKKFNPLNTELLYGELLKKSTKAITLELTPLNAAAKAKPTIKSRLTGGNLGVLDAEVTHLFADLEELAIQQSVDITRLQPEVWNALINKKQVFKDRITLIEQQFLGGNSFNQIDRMFRSLCIHSDIKDASAIILGDIQDKEELGAIRTRIIEEMARLNINVPIFGCPDIGHKEINLPVVFGANTTIAPAGDKVILTCNIHERPGSFVSNANVSVGVRSKL